MTGIMVAVAGNTQNIVYSSGLWLSELNSVDLSPITASAVNTSITRNWIGYFLSPSTGSVNLSIQAFANEGSAGGDAFTVGRLWLGSNAAAGNDANADIVASGNQTITVSFNLVAGVYYPLRIRYIGSYSEGFFGDNSSGGVTFLASGSSNVSGRIFYNSLTNGF